MLGRDTVPIVLRIVPILFLLIGSTTPDANAQNSSTVVVAPVSSLAKTPPKQLASIGRVVESGFKSLGNIKVITSKEVINRSRKDKNPKIRNCEGDLACIQTLGSLFNANFVVYGELGGLGTTEVLYLKVVDVKTGKELRSTTLNLSSGPEQVLATKAAATRLLAPNEHVGTLAVTSSIVGSVLFLDGHKIAKTPSKPVSVFVGSHALRITHPEARDYVRFVDIAFGKQTTIDATLSPLPGVSQDLTRNGLLSDPNARTNTLVKHNSTPWYFRWYTIAGGAAALAITSAIVFSSDGIDPDLSIDL